MNTALQSFPVTLISHYAVFFFFFVVVCFAFSSDVSFLSFYSLTPQTLSAKTPSSFTAKTPDTPDIGSVQQRVFFFNVFGDMHPRQHT